MKKKAKKDEMIIYSVIEQNALSGNFNMENIIKGSHPKMAGQSDR